MGADIYLIWDGITKKDKENQCKGFDITIGRLGYLRGAYNEHVGYDAIMILFADINWEKEWKVDINLLKANLEKLEKGLFIERTEDFYSKNGKQLEIQSYRDFVKFAEELVKEGKNPIVIFSY